MASDVNLATPRTTVSGLVPLTFGLNIDFVGLLTDLDPAFALGSENTQFWGPMGTAIISGLTFATFLTLVIVPVMYSSFDSVAMRIAAARGASTDAEGARSGPPESTPAAAKPPARVDPAKPRYTSGAIGAVSRSIADLKSRSIVDIDPRMIDNAGLKDRLDKDDPDHAALVKSIEEYGQQVLVLVRFSPIYYGRYEVFYGRRRVRAMQDLGLPIRAMVRDLDDKALILAQGQENNARRGLSFIEKANFAAQMRDAGYDRYAICDALAIDKTVVSRMLQIVDRIGSELITTIGAAPNVGRDRWNALAGKLEAGDTDVSTMIDMVAAKSTRNSDSNDRFEIAIHTGDELRSTPKKHTDPDGAPKPRASRRTIMGTHSGAPIARAMLGHDKVVLTLPRESGFEDWLVEHLSDLHQHWVKTRADDEQEQ